MYSEFVRHNGDVRTSLQMRDAYTIKSLVDKLQRPAWPMLEIDKLEERALPTLPKQEKPSPRPKAIADSLEQLDALTITFRTRYMHCSDDFT
jgi:hypothetical protein